MQFWDSILLKVKLAVDEINDLRSNGITFNIKTYDDSNNPTEATNIARRIVTDDMWLQ